MRGIWKELMRTLPANPEIGPAIKAFIWGTYQKEYLRLVDGD